MGPSYLRPMPGVIDACENLTAGNCSQMRPTYRYSPIVVESILTVLAKCTICGQSTGHRGQRLVGRLDNTVTSAQRILDAPARQPDADALARSVLSSTAFATLAPGSRPCGGRRRRHIGVGGIAVASALRAAQASTRDTPVGSFALCAHIGLGRPRTRLAGGPRRRIAVGKAAHQQDARGDQPEGEYELQLGAVEQRQEQHA